MRRSPSPSPRSGTDRLALVLRVVYLIFNEGYASSGGPDLDRTDLAWEAIRLGRLLHELLPDEPEPAGLLALMLLTEARRPARTTEDGTLVPLAEQDRARWDRELIAEGTALATAALEGGPMGEYGVQAAIAALHDAAPSHAGTDWPRIASLYAVLERMTDSPVVRLNRAVAVAMVEGPDAGLSLLDTLTGSGPLRTLPPRARRACPPAGGEGRRDGAHAEYVAAAAGTDNLRERDYLMMKAARCWRPSADISPPSRDR